jgi:serine/threonine protein kinase
MREIKIDPNINVIRQIGAGYFSTVYLAKINEICIKPKELTEVTEKDEIKDIEKKKKTKRVAIKIFKKDDSRKEKLTKEILTEIEILKKFKNSNYVINLIDYKINETHMYVITELLGGDLYSVIKHYKNNNRIIPLKFVKSVSKQILQGLSELHNKDVIHMDLKPENILIVNPLAIIFKTGYNDYMNKVIPFVFASYKTLYDVNINTNKINNISVSLNRFFSKYYDVIGELSLYKSQVKIADFGNAFTKQMSIDRKKDFEYQRPTRHYISPEQLLIAPTWTKSDVWSFGCIFYELLTSGGLLFEPSLDNNMGVNSTHLLYMMEIFGRFPEKLLKEGRKTNRYFLKVVTEDNPHGEMVHKFGYLLTKRLTLRKIIQLKTASVLGYNKKLNEIMEFLDPIFQLDPDNRYDAEQCLQSKFLK